MNRIVRIDESLCTGCGKCVRLCPKKILYLAEPEHVCRVNDESRCDRSRGCERACPTKAIQIL